jgi:hypothetical protein
MKNLLLSSLCLHSLSSLQSVIEIDKFLTPSGEHIPIRIRRPDNKHNIMRFAIDLHHKPSADALASLLKSSSKVEFLCYQWFDIGNILRLILVTKNMHATSATSP